MTTKNTPLMDLVDVLNGLTIQAKILDGLMSEYVIGSREQADFENRFHSSVWLITDTLKKVKPLVEKTIEKGYSFFGSNKDNAVEGAVSADTPSIVLTGEGEEVVVE